MCELLSTDATVHKENENIGTDAVQFARLKAPFGPGSGFSHQPYKSEYVGQYSMPVMFLSF